MSKEKIPSTPAILELKAKGADFSIHTYAYEEKGGTRVSSAKLGVDEHCVIKTLVMEDESAKPLIILMHGDKEVSTKALARFLGVKSIAPCKPDIAHKHTGYLVGGTSPFGTKKPLSIYMEKSIIDLTGNSDQCGRPRSAGQNDAFGIGAHSEAPRGQRCDIICLLT